MNFCGNQHCARIPLVRLSR